MKNVIAIVLLASICTDSSPVSAQKKRGVDPHLIVYKTKRDYKNNVSVILSENKSTVVTYPDPLDLKELGNDVVPTPLHRGYLIDNRGVGVNTAFLKMTNREYAKLPKVPTTEELYKKVLDKDPMVEIYDCGDKYAYKNPVAQINAIIDRGKLSAACKAIKKAGR